MFEDEDDDLLLEGSEELLKAVVVPPEFDRILAYQTVRVQPPEGEGDQLYMVLGAQTRVLDDDTVQCFAILHGHSPVPCWEFLTSWRLPELL